MKIFLLLISLPFFAYSQPNCNAFLAKGDTSQYKACLVASSHNDKYYQFDLRSEKILDSAIKICPHFAYAYSEKSVPYLKSGDFITWKALIDKAVKYDAPGYLGYRGWCRLQFFRDYKGAISDFDQLLKISPEEIGVSSNGDYHLNIARGICYAALHEELKAASIIEAQLKVENYAPGPYDYYQLGVIYFKLKNYTKALECFMLQSKRNELGENDYYRARVLKLTGDRSGYKTARNSAILLFKKDKIMFDTYTHPFNEVYLKDVIRL